MIEKIGSIKNPLTIIAVFAGVAEISGVGVLPFIAQENQTVYVWFLMLFPSLLILLFFLTLNFNHTVLYAPSDYKNEDHFLLPIQRVTAAEAALKLEADVLEEQAATEQAGTEEPAATEQAGTEERPATEQAQSVSVSASEDRSMKLRSSKLSSTPFRIHAFGTTDNRARHLLAEGLIFIKLATEFPRPIEREVRVGAAGGSYIFDGVVFDRSAMTIIEVKYMRQGLFPSSYLHQVLDRIQKTVTTFENSTVPKVRVLLALVSDEAGPPSNSARMNALVDRFRSEFSFAIEIRLYNLNDLKREIGTGA
jgi:hypothetical protein